MNNESQFKTQEKRNPVYQAGYEKGKADALQAYYDFLMDRMQTLTDIPGIGEKIAWKIQEHFLKGMEI